MEKAVAHADNSVASITASVVASVAPTLVSQVPHVARSSDSLSTGVANRQDDMGDALPQIKVDLGADEAIHDEL